MSFGTTITGGIVSGSGSVAPVGPVNPVESVFLSDSLWSANDSLNENGENAKIRLSTLAKTIACFSPNVRTNVIILMQKGY